MPIYDKTIKTIRTKWMKLVTSGEKTKCDMIGAHTSFKSLGNVLFFNWDVSTGLFA